ncbi:MAG: Na Exchanger protein, partial [Candidatus Thermoplasmatota archaeon]|nr:Na Exchanger protein [Candidatus Thermoplasmatota archaeon]
VLVLVGFVMVFAVSLILRHEVSEIVKHVNYSNLGVRSESKGAIVGLVSWIVAGATMSALAIVSTWTYSWQFSLVVVVAYVVSLVVVMFSTYARIHIDAPEMPQKVYNFPKPVLACDDGEKELPKPVYGVVKSIPRNAQL